MFLLSRLERVDPAGVPEENLARLGGYSNLRLCPIQLFVSRVNGSLKFVRKCIELKSYCLGSSSREGPFYPGQVFFI